MTDQIEKRGNLPLKDTVPELVETIKKLQEQNLMMHQQMMEMSLNINSKLSTMESNYMALNHRFEKESIKPVELKNKIPAEDVGGEFNMSERSEGQPTLTSPKKYLPDQEQTDGLEKSSKIANLNEEDSLNLNKGTSTFHADLNEEDLLTKFNWLIARGNLARDTNFLNYRKRCTKDSYEGPATTTQLELNQLKATAKPPASLELKANNVKMKGFETQMSIYLNTLRIPDEFRYSAIMSYVSEADQIMLRDIQQDKLTALSRSNHLNFTDAIMVLEFTHRIKSDVTALINELVRGKYSTIWNDAIDWVNAVTLHLGKFNNDYPEPRERLRILLAACKSNKDIYLYLGQRGHTNIDVCNSTVTNDDVRKLLNDVEHISRILGEVHQVQSIRKKHVDDKTQLNNINSTGRGPSPKESQRYGRGQEKNHVADSTYRGRGGRSSESARVFSRSSTNRIRGPCDACLGKGHLSFDEVCPELKNKDTESWKAAVKRNSEARRVAATNRRNSNNSPTST